MTDYWNNKSEFILYEDKYASMTVDGDYIDGKKYVIRGGIDNGKIGELKYSIKYIGELLEIDFITIKDNAEKGRILGLIKPINENRFLMTWCFDGKRDLSFEEIDPKQILKL